MKKGLIGLLSLLLVAMMVGCGGSTPDSQEPGQGGRMDERMADTEATADVQEGSGTAVVEVEEAIEEAVEAVAEEMTEETTAGDLTGTKWVYDEIELEFREGNKVFLKGGPLASLAPDGTEADYTLEDETFEVVVLGQTYSGTFDGSTLIVDGKPAVLQQ